MEEVSDDEGETPATKKKKKKPKKKKKKPAASTDVVATLPEVPEEKGVPVNESPTVKPEPTPPAPAPVTPKKAKQVKSPSSPPTKATQSSPAPLPPYMSTTSLTESTAQSARSYLQKEHLTEVKEKVKSRPGYGSMFAKGVLAKLGVGKEPEETQKKSKKSNPFQHLSKKMKTYMHQLLNTSEDDTKGSAPMKWETFVKVS
jgi:hypothetical protein